MDNRADLAAAYGLRTPADNRRYYAGWAARYDADFADAMAYRQPALVAEAFVGAGGGGPVLDVGAGTGLLGVALAAMGVGPVDGIDISPEMLTVARGKGCYRSLTEADLTQPLPPLQVPYAGIVSSGTFTHGHLGPEVLAPLINLAATGSVFALSIHSGVWDTRGFEAAFSRLEPLIDDLSIADRAIYAAGAPGDHAADRSRIVTFRRRAV